MTGLQSAPNRGYIGTKGIPFGFGKFGGSAYATIPQAAAAPFAPTNNFTIEALINSSFSGVNQMIYTTTNGITNVYLYITTTGTIWALLRDDALNQVAAISAGTVNNGVDRYVAVTIDLTANQMIIYIDGVQSGATADITVITLPITYGDIDIGALNSGGSRQWFFNGNMKVVHYTNKTKSPAEILATQGSGILPDVSTVALWDLRLSTLDDQVNSNDMTNQGILFTG